VSGRPYRTVSSDEGGPVTTVRVQGTDQDINHTCTWECPGPQVRTYTRELVDTAGTLVLWYFAECSACESISGLAAS